MGTSTSQNAISFSFETSRSIKNSAYQAMFCQFRNGHVPKSSMTCLLPYLGTRGMQNPERRTEEGTRRNEEIEECLTDTAGGCTEAEKLILPKKALVGTARGNRIHGLRRKGENGLGDVCGGFAAYHCMRSDHFKRWK